MAGPVPQVSKLYPDVQFPVRRGTPSISPLVTWDHEEIWHVVNDFTDVSNCYNGKYGTFLVLCVNSRRDCSE
jgi:fatty acid synthase